MHQTFFKYAVALTVVFFFHTSCAGQNQRIARGDTWRQHVQSENDTGRVIEGRCSYYGAKFHGRTTASGEVFNMYDFTAAHRTLPFGTILEVENRSNGYKVTVRINDRGPFKGDRILDLSYAAAQKLDMIRSGTAHIRAVVILPDNNNRK